MSNWVKPMVAATKAVRPPTTATTSSAVGAYSNTGDSRQSMKTPAVTMVAAWMSADTGVGPSIASGSQVCRPSCADLPMAPMNNSRQAMVRPLKSQLRKCSVSPVSVGALAKIASNWTEPVSTKIAKMPRAKPKSPTRLTRKAFMAAALAEGFSYQKLISR